MNSPRIEVDLAKIRQNTKVLTGRLKARGISVLGVTKAVCGNPVIAQAMLDGGVSGLADARVSNVQRMREAGISAPITLIRTPLLSQLTDVVESCGSSYNTERRVISALAAASTDLGINHGIILVMEAGDMRDGILPKDIISIAKYVAGLQGVTLKGIAANFACFSRVPPDQQKMVLISEIAKDVEAQCGRALEIVSGGNSSNIPMALSRSNLARINELRIGEAILLGVDPVSGDRIPHLHTDAFVLIAEVIEMNDKSDIPLQPQELPKGSRLQLVRHYESGNRVIISVGQQDTDCLGLTLPSGMTHLGSTSDHLVLRMSHSEVGVGTEIRFGMNYSALMRAMATPNVQISFLHPPRSLRTRKLKPAHSHLNLV
ncbi:alanine racemase [Phaeobacter sp. 11ANDIMAR09]|uniref:alanine racemase n=1 Tax=Phaeobacter sp. 11ANDIMAR09 TaxID=1225647 RepID=UPI0006C8A3C4|nr:alanine racemase [Phaeobacter sp. 11ANDIMAR09]KPD11042.1 hypothetical protein AN476_17585 [Phaeobacter sp. 11ANDIMAR09]